MPGSVWRSPEDCARWLPSWLPSDRRFPRASRGSSPAICVRIGARSCVIPRSEEPVGTGTVPRRECIAGLADNRRRCGGRGMTLDRYGADSSAQFEEAGMATKVAVALEDDLDGGPADETVRFEVRGTQYEIDLNN